MRHGQRGQAPVGYEQGSLDVCIGTGGRQLGDAACTEADGGGIGPVGGERHGAAFSVEGSSAQWTRIGCPLASPRWTPPRRRPPPCRHLALRVSRYANERGCRPLSGVEVCPCSKMARRPGQPWAGMPETQIVAPKLGTTAPDRWRQSSPLAGPAFCPGPGSGVRLRLELDLSRDRVNRFAILSRPIASLCEAGWIALSSPRLASAAHARAPTTRCLFLLHLPSPGCTRWRRSATRSRLPA